MLSLLELQKIYDLWEIEVKARETSQVTQPTFMAVGEPGYRIYSIDRDTCTRKSSSEKRATARIFGPVPNSSNLCWSRTLVLAGLHSREMRIVKSNSIGNTIPSDCRVCLQSLMEAVPRRIFSVLKTKQIGGRNEEEVSEKLHLSFTCFHIF